MSYRTHSPGLHLSLVACSFQYVLIAFLRSRFKVQQGLNFTVDIEFGFATMISVKQPEGKKNAYCVVFYDV